MMAATSAAVAPLVQIAVRSYAIDQFGTAHAGYWEAMQRISSTYLGLVTTTLAVYFLPRIAELSTGAEIRQEIKTTGRIVLPIVC
ncbi:O-antigen translocase, partial [Acinetobacter baumannii]